MVKLQLPVRWRHVATPVLLFTAACGDDPVEEPNRAPFASAAIPNATVAVGDSAALDLTPYFSDPDDDPLTFEAVSSDASVAAASASGNAVATRGVAKGTATVTVTATDPEGLSASQDFKVAVPNRQPQVADTIPGQHLFRGDSATVGVAPYFSDPDGDALAFEATSSDASVATVSVSGSTVAILAVASGRAAATVTAADPEGLSVSQDFEITVPNRPPAVTDSIADQELFRGDSATLDMTAHFDDPDGDALIFTAETSDEGVVSASVSGSVMTVTGVAEGEAEITVTATDPDALSATLSAEITVIHPDRAALVALFEAAGGPNWNRNDNWLSDEPLDRWRGVGVNGEGRVIRLFMQGNNLTGRIPPEFGALTELENATLSFNRLSGAIPPELGALTKLKELDLGANDLDRPIPPELGRLSSLVELSLYQNRLPGPFPPELGGLANLEVLSLAHNRFASPIPKEFGDLSELRVLYVANAGFRGEIPPELGRLAKLEHLNLGWNDLTGAIPPEMGRLTNLLSLILTETRLTGSIPPELGELSSLELLAINVTPLSGPIPPELGQLSNLTTLRLHQNRLDGPVPPELGQLSSLTWMSLYGNALTGEVPAELGLLSELEGILLFRNDLEGSLPAELADMESLKWLWLSDNELTGSVPPEFGDFPALDELDLTNNAGMSGPLPVDLKDLGRFNALLAGGTDLCAPSDAAFQKWLRRVPRQRVARCSEGEPPAVYLVQAAQSPEFPTPLVADERALLRVFVTSPNAGGAGIPPVTATFFAEGEEVHVAEIPAKSTPIPKTVDEGDLKKSSNAVVPDSVLREGLELVVEIDPDSTLHDSIAIVRRIPETGRTGVDVMAVPTFDLTAIPFLWTEEPDSAVLDIVAEMARDPESDELLFETRTLLPVGELEVTAHEPAWTSSRSAFDILRQTEAIRVAEGGTRYYQGLLEESTGAAGVAYRPGWSSFSRPVAATMAHEFGHNMSLFHAPCGGAGGPDPAFPRRDGSIGVWGYDFRDDGALVSPKTADLMGYCGPRWISEYHFGSALRYRMWAEDVWEEDDRSGPPQALLLWGGVDAGGEPFLEPAFVIDAPAALPARAGDYRLSGHTADKRELFSVSFEMADVADGDGSRSFAFALPARPEWADRLAAITLEGPGGSAALDLEPEAGAGMAMLRDPETGQVRGFVRVPEPGQLARSVAMALAAEPDLVVQFSAGIPDAEAWRR